MTTPMRELNDLCYLALSAAAQLAGFFALATCHWDAAQALFLAAIFCHLRRSLQPTLPPTP